MTPLEAAAMVIYEHRRTVDMPMWSEIADKRTNLGAVLATLDARAALTAAVNALPTWAGESEWAEVDGVGGIRRDVLLRALVGETSVSGNEE